MRSYIRATVINKFKNLYHIQGEKQDECLGRFDEHSVESLGEKQCDSQSDNPC